MVLIAGTAVGAVLMVGRASVLPPAPSALPSGRPVAMRPLDDDVPISAQLTLSAATSPASAPSSPAWASPAPASSSPALGPSFPAKSATVGTRIDLVCFYAQNTEYPRAYPIRLLAYGTDGATEQVGSWIAVAGRTFVTSGVTRFAPDELSRLELVASDGTALLAYDVP